LTKVLYGVSPIGLGHASRAVAVGGELVASGVEITFATGGPAASFLRSYGFDVREVVSEPNPTVWRGRNIFSSLWYLRYWRGYRSSKARMGKLRNEMRPDIVVGDEEFSVLTLAADGGTKGIMISDELELGFARTFLSRRIEPRVARWYKELQESVSLLIVPDYGTDERNIWHCGPIVRKVTGGRKETFESLRLPKERELILVSLSGSGSGTYLVPAVEKAVAHLGLDVTVAVAGGRPIHGEGRLRHLGFVRDLQNLVAAADLVVSQAGKSTIDEAFSSGTPIIAIPLKDHFEQEANAKALGFSHDDVNTLGPLIAERIGRRAEPRNYDGARRAADRILGLI
jgi:UDP-N-acetylglucosamine--N-acetylmuramyl-(pentapeptide) pyrophosphoryl-undecaprenol N-acetylglucosamine transferase